MDMQISLLLLAMVTIAAQRVIVLWWYRRWFRQGLVGDAAYHFSIVRALRENSLFKGVPQFLMTPSDTPSRPSDNYPVLFHRFCSLFTVRLLSAHQYLPNVVLAVLFALAYVLFLQGNGFPPMTIGLALLIHVISPGNLAFPRDAILYLSLSERLMAKLSVGLYFLCLALFMIGGQAWLMVASIAMGAIAVLCSKFARQAVLFVSVAFAVISFSPFPLLALLGVALGGLVVERERFVEGLRDQVAFLRAYNRHTKKGRYFSASLSGFVSLRQILSRSESLPAKVATLEHKEPTSLAFRSPETLLVLYLGFGGYAQYGVFFHLALAATAIYLLVACEPFRQFGEALRYPEYVMSFVAPTALALALPKLTEVHAQVIAGAYLLAVLFAVACEWHRHRRQTFALTDKLSDFLRQAGLGADSIILTVPVNLAPAVTARLSCSTICYPGNYGSWMFRDYIEEYPFPKRDWRSIARRHSVTHLIVQTALEDEAARTLGWCYEFPETAVICQAHGYRCYRLGALTEADVVAGASE